MGWVTLGLINVVLSTDLAGQLWDVASDQDAVDLIRDIDDAQQASDTLLKHALSNHTTDNVTVLVVRFKHAVRRAPPAPVAAADDTVVA